MKLYTSTGAPNPERVRLFLAERGLDVETELVSLRDGQQFSQEFRAINPDAVVPALVLDDGTPITESLAICRYLDVAFPGPRLFGETPREIGLIEMWLRKLEFSGYLPTQDAYRNGHPGFAGRGLPGTNGDMPQIPELVARSNAVMRRLLNRLDRQLDAHEFVAGASFSMADIVLFTTVSFGQRTRFEVVQDLSEWPSVVRWQQAMATRPALA